MSTIRIMNQRGVITETPVVFGAFPISPEDPKIPLVQEQHLNHKGNDSVGFWRNPITKNLYKEVSDAELTM